MCKLVLSFFRHICCSRASKKRNCKRSTLLIWE
nr:MAG TPA: hypothetical protein [Caudoviricetes sp.]